MTLFVAQTHGLEHVIYKVVQLRVVDHRLFETLFGVVRTVDGAD